MSASLPTLRPHPLGSCVKSASLPITFETAIEWTIWGMVVLPTLLISHQAGWVKGGEFDGLLKTSTTLLGV